MRQLHNNKSVLISNPQKKSRTKAYSEESESYYPEECYLEDNELEKIESIKNLRSFKPVVL